MSKVKEKPVALPRPWIADKRLSVEQRDFLSAMQASLGIVSTAVEKIRATGRPQVRSTHWKWKKENAVYAEYLEDVLEECKDFGESQLYAIMRGVDVKKKTTRTLANGEVIVEVEEFIALPDKSAIIFYNKTKNKDRGYIERNEITGKDGEPIQLGMSRVVIKVKDPDPEKNG